MESLGPFCSERVTFLNELDHRMIIATGDVHDTAHLFQRHSVAGQHFNNVLIWCSFGATVYDDKDYIKLDFVCACMFYLFNIMLIFLHV